MGTISRLLKDHFETRRQKNPRFSLRAFARYLDIDPPTLSKIFNHKKQPGPRLTQRLAAKIGIDSRQITQPANYSPGFDLIAADQFQMISRWYYFALLELISLPEFATDSKKISDKLGLSLTEVNIALERLERLGQIARDKAGWKDLTSGFTTVLGQEVTSTARRSHQAELLQLALSALETVSPDLRDHTSLTMAIDKVDLPKLKDVIKKFRRDMARLAVKSSRKNEVYNLSIALWPLSRVSDTALVKKSKKGSPL